MKDLFIKFFKFGVVGGIGTFIDFAITAILMYMFGLQEFLSKDLETFFASGVDNVALVVMFANLVGFVVAATSNYFFNRIWTFNSKNPDVSSEYTRFFIVSLIGLVINLGVIYLCNIHVTWSFTFMGFFFSSFWIAKIVATFVVMFWNFFANNYFTFRRRKVLKNE